MIYAKWVAFAAIKLLMLLTVPLADMAIKG